MLWSQHEEDWRERVKSGKMVSTIEPSTCSHPTSARQKGANQDARCENCMNCQQRLSTEKRDLDGEARLLEGGEGSTRESLGEGGNGQKDGGTEKQSFPIRSKTA